MSQQEDQKNKFPFNMSPTIQFMLLCICLVVVVAIIYLTFIRYKYVGEAIQNKNTLGALALLSPELTGSIGAILAR